jgi:hypothetical protein
MKNAERIDCGLCLAGTRLHQECYAKALLELPEGELHSSDLVMVRGGTPFVLHENTNHIVASMKTTYNPMPRPRKNFSPRVKPSRSISHILDDDVDA